MTSAAARNLSLDRVFDVRVRAKAVAAVLVMSVAAFATTVASSGAGSRASRSIVLGTTPTYPSSGCPSTHGCEVVARVTGIQMRAAGVNHPFRAPVDGQIVAWWLKLPELRRSQIKSFAGFFGG